MKGVNKLQASHTLPKGFRSTNHRKGLLSAMLRRADLTTVKEHAMAKHNWEYKPTTYVHPDTFVAQYRETEDLLGGLYHGTVMGFLEYAKDSGVELSEGEHNRLKKSAVCAMRNRFSLLRLKKKYTPCRRPLCPHCYQITANMLATDINGALTKGKTCSVLYTVLEMDLECPKNTAELLNYKALKICKSLKQLSLHNKGIDQWVRLPSFYIHNDILQMVMLIIVVHDDEPIYRMSLDKLCVENKELRYSLNSDTTTASAMFNTVYPYPTDVVLSQRLSFFKAVSEASRYFKYRCKRSYK